MFRLTIANGTHQVVLILFDALEKIIGCLVTKFIETKKQMQYFELLTNYDYYEKKKKPLLI